MDRRFDAVIFDMDGTLVVQRLDFHAIRRQLGIAPQEGILEAIAAMTPAQRAGADEFLLAQELHAASETELMPGAREVLSDIRDAGLKTALLTRNAGQAMRIVLQKFGLQFDLAWSRENGPIKPRPEGVLRACEFLRVDPQRTVCVGDYHYDVLAANAAGAASVLLCRTAKPSWADQAHHVIENLTDLLDIVDLSRDDNGPAATDAH